LGPRNQRRWRTLGSGEREPPPPRAWQRDLAHRRKVVRDGAIVIHQNEAGEVRDEALAFGEGGGVLLRKVRQPQTRHERADRPTDGRGLWTDVPRRVLHHDLGSASGRPEQPSIAAVDGHPSAAARTPRMSDLMAVKISPPVSAAR
jgi:hypothetical protein